MSSTYADCSKRLLALASKAAAGQPWNRAEQAQVAGWLDTEGDLGLLAACCVLTVGRPPGCDQALRKVKLALARSDIPAYLELCLYEALAFIDSSLLSDCHQQILAFARRTLLMRRIDPTNTVYVLGKLARAGNADAVHVLELLRRGPDAAANACARLVLEGLASPDNDGSQSRTGA